MRYTRILELERKLESLKEKLRDAQDSDNVQLIEESEEEIEKVSDEMASLENKYWKEDDY
jgi:vacuolar-type H+-ATPase subunit I/STV1